MITPWFAAIVDGVADPRRVDPHKFVLAVTERRCWISGEKLGETVAFVVSPESFVAGATVEPPMRPDMAHMAAKHCPHLAQPGRLRRREEGEELGDGPPGLAEAIVFETREYTPMETIEGDFAFSLGRPDVITRYRGGQPVC